MNAQQPPDDWIRAIQDRWTPEPTDARSFDHRLHARLRGQRRRRTVLVSAAVAVAALVGVSHLVGGEVEPRAPIVEAPAPSPVVASAEPATGSSFFAQALDHDQRSFELPGAYGALDELFLDPYDQEL